MLNIGFYCLTVFKPPPSINGSPMRARIGEVVGNSTYTISLSNRPAIIRRGSRGSAYIYIHGNAVRVRIAVSSTDPAVIVLDIVPKSGVTPFTSRVDVYASPTARIGTYYLEATIMHASTGTRLAQTIIPVFVVDDSVLVDVLENINEYRGIYQRYGAQYAVIKIMTDYNLELTYTHLKLLYEALLGRRISNGTVGDLLSRLVRKGLIIKIEDRYCINKRLDLETAKTVIDAKRAANGMKGARATLSRIHKSNREESRIENKPTLPRSIEKALSIALRLIREDYWKGVDFIAHTLVGVRKTGAWILWIRDYFICKERKTGFLHYFRSKTLSEVLRTIGLREGFMIEHVNHSVEDIVQTYYGSYANARRLHYALKELGWFEYGEPIILEIYYSIYSQYLALRKLYTDEVLVEIGDPSYRDRAKKFLIYGGEHVDKENEEAYFHRPAGLY